MRASFHQTWNLNVQRSAIPILWPRSLISFFDGFYLDVPQNPHNIFLSYHLSPFNSFVFLIQRFQLPILTHGLSCWTQIWSTSGLWKRLKRNWWMHWHWNVLEKGVWLITCNDTFSHLLLFAVMVKHCLESIISYALGAHCRCSRCFLIFWEAKSVKPDKIQPKNSLIQ